MKIGHLALLATLGIALGGSARADDIVYFTNGTAMPVRSHKIEKGMIRVDLGSNAAMAFPVSMVERVESAGRNVFPNSASPANRAIAGAAPSTVQTGYGSVPAQFRQMRRDDPEQQLAQARARAQNPSPAGSPAGTNTAAKRNLRIMAPGNPVLNEDGTFRRGNVSVIPSPNAPVNTRGGDDSKPVITSLGPNTEAVPDPDEGSDDGDGDDTADPDADDPPDEN